MVTPSLWIKLLAEYEKLIGCKAQIVIRADMSGCIEFFDDRGYPWHAETFDSFGEIEGTLRKLIESETKQEAT